MKTTTLTLATAVVFGLAILPSAIAGGASGITSVTGSGPGGTYTNGVTGSTFTEPQLRYSSVDYIDLSITVDTSGTYNINEAISSGFVQNNTGQVWTGFDLSVLAGSLGTFINPPSPNNWGDFSETLPITNYAPSNLDVFMSGGTVAGSGSEVEPTGDFTMPSAGTFTVRETPIAAPEPSSLALAGLGAFGTGLIRRRVRQG